MSMKCKKRTKYSINNNSTKSKYGIILLVLILLTMMTGYLLLYTDIFIVKEIEVRGNELIEENEIVRLSDLEKGMNIFKFNNSDVESKVNRHSFIKSANTSRKLPNTITIEIIERETHSIIPFEDGTYLYVDNEGVVVEKDENLKSFTKPLITGLDDVSYIIGNKIEISPSSLEKSIFKIINILVENNWLDKFSEIHILENFEVQLYTVDGSIINIGNEKILEEKINFVDFFISQPHPKLIVDMSHGGDPVYKPHTY